MTMQTTIPTPAEFLLSSEPDEEAYEPFEQNAARLDALERRVYALEAERGAQPIPAVLETAACTECADFRSEAQTLRETYAEMGHAYAGAVELVEQIEGIVKKSSSKVSLEVKAAIEAWRSPAAEPEPEGEPAAEGTHTRTSTDSGPDFCRECSDAAGDWMEWPCPAQPIEEWRAYARGLGYTGADVDTMNRSQIRTMLGIEQPVAPSSAGSAEPAGA
ncbi:hypothetical protein RB608_11850 [Nocardioides sp. LHD-245]|uniref:hypothetical protein n=1 Tax=Nocardioides sp. LHD-245 TaxID=3051387 RepID=UPI0027E1B455|nr:hypothetical protein [Nocardioides sp. LHD-245]